MTAKVATSPVATSPIVTVKAPRAKTCSDLVSVGLGEAGCKRLPRHKDEHRVTLHRPAVVKAAKVGSRKVTRKVARTGSAGKAFAAELALAVEAGTMTASAALAKFASRIR